ncbi:MAG: LysR family transcriptional regulator [Bacteriovoracaceae bacterium]|jgi:LysR family transcriptional activator of nhaA|nr:hypothetical protein [Halobacteriovoraceae bacterium]MDP7321145.1 LysR family transcriptional regulator [Bacteriovoracaceae bacterium]
MYKLNFNHLYYFLTIAREGSIVKAAKKLNMTQPSLSHQLKNLETDLGHKLFDRIGKRLVLNKDGQLVQDYATKIFRNSEEMMSMIHSGHGQQVKIIKVGVISWIPVQKVYEIVKPLIYNKYIQVQIIHNDQEVLLKSLQRNQLDIIICDSPYLGRSKKLQAHPLSKENLICVSSLKTKLHHKFPVGLNDQRIVNYHEKSELSEIITHFLQSSKIEYSLVGEFSNPQMVLETIYRSNIIGFLPESVAQEALKEKKIKKLGVIQDHYFSLWAITSNQINSESLIYEVLG